MTTLDVPRDGRATFRRLGVRALRDSLLADEAREPSHDPVPYECYCAATIETYLRPIAYLARGLGT